MGTEVKSNKRLRRSRAEIEELLEAFERSGSTQQSFCLEHGLSVATFSNWRRKGQSSGAEAVPSLRPVRLTGTSVSHGPRVRLPDGVEVFLPEGSSAREIAALIVAIRASGSC